MLLDLRGFQGGTDELARQFPASAFALEGEDFRIVGPVHLTARLEKDKEKVRLVGRLKATLETDCGRCLEALPVTVDAKLDVLFLPEGEPVAAARNDEMEVREADTGVSFYKNDTIDLGEMMRDEFYLALPMKPLCRADCKGLCPVCGVNRNRETCTCREEWIDPRMEPLKKFLE